LLEGADLSEWDVSGAGLGLFTLLLAIDANRYPDEQLRALAERFRPGCSRVHTLFDMAFVDEELRGVQRPFLMTTDHDHEPLAEALWFAIDLAVHEDVTQLRESAVVTGTDREEWDAEVA
jgi:hypothetical protein